MKRLGDGLMLAFADPDHAVRAAVELVAAVPAPLRLRGGWHLGHAVVTSDDVLGHVVNIAARVTDVGFTGPTTLALKGIDQPISVYCACA